MHSLAVFAVHRNSIRMPLAIAAHLLLDLYHIKLASALLHEKYEGSAIYMQSPFEFDGA